MAHQTESRRDMTPTANSIVLSREDFALPLGEGWVLRRAHPDRLLALNATGKLVWDLWELGLAAERIAKLLAERFRLPLATTSAEVASAIAGLERAEPMPPQATAAVDAALPAPIECGVFRFGAQGMRVRSNVAILGVNYFSRFARRRASDAEPADLLELSGEPSGFRLTLRGETLARLDTLADLVARTTELLLRREHPEIDFLAYFHAASLGRGRQAVLLPGDSGAGKSTLVGYLSCRGFTYLGDDIVALSTSDWSLRPLPTSLSLKAGSWPVLAELFPQLESRPVMNGSSGPLRYVEPENLGDRGGAPSIILFPAYARGQETQLTRLSPLETITRLLDSKMDIDAPATEAKLAELLRFLETTPAYRVAYSDLESAHGAVETLLQTHDEAGP